jgi:hypothetical protein
MAEVVESGDVSCGGLKRSAYDQPALLEGVKALLVDIEGTSIPQSFVKVCHLFCYCYRGLGKWGVSRRLEPRRMPSSGAAMYSDVLTCVRPRECLCCYILCKT